MREDQGQLESAIRKAKNEFEKLEEYNFAPIYNSREIIHRIEINISDKIFLSEKIDSLNLGLLSSKALDYIPKFQDYANALHEIMENLFLFLGQPFVRPTYFPQKIAYDFYQSQGFDDKKIRSHLQGIDFRFNVSILTLKKGQTIAQWKLNTMPQGNYYSDTGKNPDCLGINSKQEDLQGKIGARLEHKYDASQSLEVLMSTAAAVLDIWSVKGQPIQTRGGCVQYFNENEKKDINYIP